MAEERVSEGAIHKVTLSSVFRDNNLSYGARGILAYMLTYPKGWVFNSINTFYSEKGKRYKINCFIDELQENGYVEVVKGKCVKGKYIKQKLKVSDFLLNEEVGLRGESEEKSRIHKILVSENEVNNKKLSAINQTLSANNQHLQNYAENLSVDNQTLSVNNQHLQNYVENLSVGNQTLSANNQHLNNSSVNNQTFSANNQHYSNSNCNSNSNSYVNSYCYSNAISNMDNLEKFVHVKLSKEEYEDLVSRYGQELVMLKINSMEEYVARTKKVYYKPYKILGFWLENEMAKKKLEVPCMDTSFYERERERERLYLEREKEMESERIYFE